MKAFFDTSSILKLYHDEEGSGELEDYFNRNIDIIILSELADLEFRSAIWRKVRMEEIEEQVARQVINCFENDYNNFVWIEIKNNITQVHHTYLEKTEEAPKNDANFNILS